MNFKLPIGVSDFKEIIEGNYYYIDKTLLIQEILQSGAKVFLLPRPRRFGKTLNVSMLRYFFEKRMENPISSDLFHGLAIEQVDEATLHQNRYPVIFLNFKDVKERSWEATQFLIKKIIAAEYQRHEYLLDSEVLGDFERKIFLQIRSLEAELIFYQEALKDLSHYLQRYHQESVMIFIDEYDAPIQAGYVHHYYDDVIHFMRGLLSGGLKDNQALEKGILTGILRVAKESIFSGLNNLSVYSLLNEKFNRHFGLLTEEVKDFLDAYGLAEKLGEVTDWYNGYRFGGKIVYNPWSIVKYIESGGQAEAYWVNTSGNDLIRQLITKAGAEFKKDLELLLDGGSVRQQVYENVTFEDIEVNQTIWSFLLFSGYLMAAEQELIQGRMFCRLQIPNLEVKYIYEEIIRGWFSNTIHDEKLHLMLQGLITGDIETFEQIFQEFIIYSMSHFDLGNQEPEKVYHAFVLGMLLYLSDQYEIKSNRESGYGRYDLLLMPRDLSRLGIVIEFKKTNQLRNESLQQAAERGLAQLEEKQYRQELFQRGVKQILELAIAFKGKQILVLERNIAGE